MVDRVDHNGVPLYEGDRVIMARPDGYKSARAVLAYATITNFSNKTVSVLVDGESHAFATPFRSNKFIKVENDSTTGSVPGV